MPELPEVETTRRGIEPHVKGGCVADVIVRQPKLRWPIPVDLKQHLVGKKIRAVERRAKYLLLNFEHGSVIMHLGMSGHLHIVTAKAAPEKHDHFELQFDSGQVLRLRDPRRFGAVLWAEDPMLHPLLAKLGPEPLSPAFTAKYFFAAVSNKKAAIKKVLMDNAVVVGVGNIYASESLFAANIHPERPANSITEIEAKKLVTAVRKILRAAIKQGGTTLRDFMSADGKPGYFRHALQVYGRVGEPCYTCGGEIESVVIGQRNTFYCDSCQPLE